MVEAQSAAALVRALADAIRAVADAYEALESAESPSSDPVTEVPSVE